jgi:hypothetical protein
MNRAYTPQGIRQLIADHKIHVNITSGQGGAKKTSQGVKALFLDCVRKMVEEGIDIERMPMKLKVSPPSSCEDQGAVKQQIQSLDKGIRLLLPTSSAAAAAAAGVSFFEILCPPQAYKAVDDCAKKIKGKVEVVELGVLPGAGFEDAAAAAAIVGDGDDDELEATFEKVALQDGGEDDTSALSGKYVRSNNSDDNSDSDDREIGEMPLPSASSSGGGGSKKAKQNNKASKKAKRREKEREAEVAEKAEKERVRKAEREASKGAASELPPPPPVEDDGKTMSCNTCPDSRFGSAAMHRAHFKSDWHRYNLKLKQLEGDVVDENEFKFVDSEALFD